MAGVRERLTLNDHFWGLHISDPYVNWNTQDSAADTADEVEFTQGDIVAVRCTEAGFFRGGATGQTAANLRDYGRFTLAGETVIFWLSQSDDFLAYVAKDSVAAKWQYCILGNRSAGI